MPDFVDIFMHRVSELLAKSKHAPRSVNTWGDAIFGVFNFSHDAGLFALELTAMLREGTEEWVKKELCYTKLNPKTNKHEDYPLDIRIGLHTGPVLAHYNPILRQNGYTGSQVSRAARIEPIAEPGQIYASEEFAAMVELHRVMKSCGQNSSKVESFVCEYAGSKALAKGYPGLFRVYRVIPERSLPIEKLAEAAHKFYCQDPVGKKASSLRPWAELDEEQRDSNRAQVADIPNKLFQLGYELAPNSGLSPSQIVMTDEQIETLAKEEHERWMAEKQLLGWRYSPQRNDSLKRHDSLLHWDKLSESEKQKDREPVKKIPHYISLAGFYLRRVTS
jgi:class 3 adenylate cyclase